jgi:hypothetical protein
MYFLNTTGTSHKHLTTCSLSRLTMIYNVSGTSQNCLSAWVSIERHHRRQYTLAQRGHIVTLVDSDRAMQEDGIPFIRAVENLQVSAHSVRRWCAALQDLQDTTNSQCCNILRNHRGPAGYLDDIQEELITFVTDWRDPGMPVSFCTCAQDWAIEA